MNLTKEAKSHFLNLYSIALSDTQIDTTELMLLYEFGKDRGIEKERIDELLLNADKVRFTIPDDLLIKISYLYEFALMIWADEKVDEFEVNALKKFCYKFGFKEENIDLLSDFLLQEAKENKDPENVLQRVNSIIKEKNGSK